jgi:hypothetical protein
LPGVPLKQQVLKTKKPALGAGFPRGDSGKYQLRTVMQEMSARFSVLQIASA